MTDTVVVASPFGNKAVAGAIRHASSFGADALRTVSRVTYTTTYVLSYGVVFASLFLAKALPRENPVMHGVVDGGVAARDTLKGIAVE